MAERRPFLLRLAPEVYDALQRWAADDLRSLNGQIEFLLRRALGEEGRAPRGSAAAGEREKERGGTSAPRSGPPPGTRLRQRRPG